MPMSGPHRLAVLLIALQATFTTTYAIASRTSEPGKGQYLVPFMWHGPNNQINSIKETLALATLLGRTLALPDLHSHLSSDHTMRPIKYEDVFDLGHLMEHANVVLLSDLSEKLPWYKGALDAALILAKKVNVDDLAHQMGLQLPGERLWLDSPVSAIRGCHHEQIDQLRRMLKPYDVVGVQTYHSLVERSHWLAGPLGNGCEDICCNAYREVSRHVRKNPVITAAARRFIRQRIGKGQTFVAAHIRPFPDPCVELWLEVQNGTVPDQDIPKAMLDKCNNYNLYERIAPHIKSLLADYHTDKVFVMVHPLLRPLVLSRLRREGLEPIFMSFEEVARHGVRTGQAEGTGGDGNNDDEEEEDDEDEDEEDASHVTASVTMLAMVEEAVCEYARAFVGTKESSMTATVVQDRIAAGHSMDHMYAFIRWEGYERRPISLPQYYKEVKLREEQEEEKEPSGRRQQQGGLQQSRHVHTRRRLFLSQDQYGM